MKQTFILFLVLLGYLPASGQYCGLDSHITLPAASDSFVLEFLVNDIRNDNLASPDQGVCRIDLYFLHNSIKALNLYLESPNGTRIQLIGPDVAPDATLWTVWDISFVPDGQGALPDPGFPSRWDNNQPADFGSGFSYKGSYYPYQGSLEDFNSGPVNGTWRLVFKDPDANLIPGRLLNFRIVMCDELGQDCCLARAGQLTDPDIRYCEGSPALDIAPEPFFRTKGPDTSEYDYTYVIANYGILVGFDPDPDLSSYPPGQYTVCGLSYGKGEESKFPDTDGGLWTMSSLRQNLDGLTPVFCGQLTNDCMEINITAASPLTELFPIICEGEAFAVGDSLLTEPGNYLFNFGNADGCDSLVAIELSVFPHVQDTLMQTICSGDVVQVGTQQYDQTGYYVDTLQTYVGCDSVVHLFLEVIEPVFDTLNLVICQGDSVNVGNRNFAIAGTYDLILTSAANCDSILTLNLQVLSPQAIITGDNIRNCDLPEILLDAANATGNGPLGFEWLDASGITQSTAATFVVQSGGTYGLRVFQEAGGLTCADTAYLQISDDFEYPIAEAGPDDELTCTQNTVNLGSNTTSTGTTLSYFWSSREANLSTQPNTPFLATDQPGTYLLAVTNTRNGCVALDSVRVSIDTVRPIAEAGPVQTLTCALKRVSLDGRGTDIGSDYSYQWTSENGSGIINRNSLNPAVETPDRYTLTVTNTRNGCQSTDTAEVVIDTLLPVFDYESVYWLNCRERSVVIDAGFTTSAPDFNFRWTTDAQILFGSTTLRPTTEKAGNYLLELTYLSNSCRDTLAFSVGDTTNAITAAILPVDPLSCQTPEQLLDASPSTYNPDITYLWSSPEGLLPQTLARNTLLVDQAGRYQLTVLDTFTFCEANLPITVAIDTFPPVFSFAPLGVLNCEVSEQVLEPLIESGDTVFYYAWSGPCIMGDPSEKQVRVNCPGTYTLTLTNAQNGCATTHTIEVRSDTLLPFAEAGSGGTITCNQPFILLDGSGSSAKDSLSYTWIYDNAIAGRSATIEASEPGQYLLQVQNTLNRCVATDSVVVGRDVQAPTADAGVEQVLNCSIQRVTLGGNSSAGAEMSYAWFALDGKIPDLDTLAQVTIDTPGLYALRVTSRNNGCENTDVVRVRGDFTPPVAHAGPDKLITCSDFSPLLDGSLSQRGDSIRLSWTGPCLNGDPAQAQIRASCEGSYVLTLTNTLNGCVASDTVLLNRDTVVPLALLPDTLALSCLSGTATLDAGLSKGEQFTWFRDGVQIPLPSLQPVVDLTGSYSLVMTNPVLNCSDTATVVVQQNCQPLLTLPETQEALTCFQESVLLTPGLSPSAANYRFQWTGPDAGCFLGSTDQLQATVTCGGLYRLIATNAVLGLSDTLELRVEADQSAPEIRIQPTDTLTCVRETSLLDARASESGTGISFSWTDSFGDTLGTDPLLPVRTPGVYTLQLFNTRNGCSAVASAEVVENTRKPDIVFNTENKPCYQDTFSLSAQVFPATGNFSYQWSGTGLITAGNQPEIRVSQIGTFFLGVTDSDNGCVSRDSVMVQAPACAPCINPVEPDTLTCARTTVEVSVALCYPCDDCTFSWSSPNGTILSGGSSQRATVSSSGNYILTASSSNGLSTEVEIIVVAHKEPPLAEAGPAKLLSCLFETTTLGSSRNPEAPWLTYRWSDAAGREVGLSAAATGIQQAGWYFLQATDLRNGCSATDSVLVSIDTLRPVAALSAPDTLTCNNPLISLDGSNSSSSPRIQYAWVRGSDTLPAATTTLLTELAGPYTLIVTDVVNGCMDTKTVEVIADTAKPVFQPLPADTLTCDQPELNIRASLVNQPAASFEWCRITSSGEDCGTGQDIRIVQPGTYRVEATHSDNGCTETALLQIAADTAVPELVLDPAPLLSCDSPQVTLNAEVNFDRIFTSNWSNSTGNVLATNTLNLAVTAPGTYQLNVENPANGCQTSALTTVIQDVRLPEISAGSDTFLNCYVPSLVLNAQSVLFPNGSGDFFWQDEQGNTLEQNPVITEAGNYFLVAKDQLNGCIQQDAIRVQALQSAPVADVATPDGTTLTCVQPTLFLDGRGSSPSTILYQWLELAADGTTALMIGAKPQHEINTPGNYALVVTDETNGCQDTLTFLIGQDIRQPAIAVVPPQPLTCTQTATEIDASGSDTGSNFTFLWLDPQARTVGSSNTLTGVTAPGTYTLTVQNESNGCTNTASVAVPIDTLHPKAAIDNTGGLDCVQREAWLIADPQNNRDYSYNWSTPGGLIVGRTDSAFIRAAARGFYSVTITNRNNGCFDIATTEVVEDATPIDSARIQVQVPDCRNENNGSISIRSVAGGQEPFIYALNNRLFVDVPEFRNLSAGNYSVYIQGANGCEWSTNVALPGSDRIQIELGPDKQIMRGDSVLLTPEITGDLPHTITWTASDNSLTTVSDQLLVNPTRSTTYFATVNTAEGCSATDFITVYVQDRPFAYIPNAFSPNGDGSNDLFELYFRSEVATIDQLLLFDRWGNLVFQRNSLPPGDPGLAWDGQFNNRPVLSQVLVYQITFTLQDGTTRYEEGSFALIR